MSDVLPSRREAFKAREFAAEADAKKPPEGGWFVSSYGIRRLPADQDHVPFGVGEIGSR